MKFKTSKTELINSIRNLTAVIERRSTLAILSNIKLSVIGGDITLCATDLDIEATNTMSIDGKRDGETTVSAQTFSDVLSRLKDGDVEIDVVENSMTIKSGRSRFSLSCISADDFPKLSNDDFTVSFDIPANDLATLIDRSSFCASHEGTRYYLNGIYLHISGDNLRSVSTDGNRMACVDIAKPEGLAPFDGVIVSNKTVSVIRKVLGDSSEIVNVGISNHKIMVRGSAYCITSKLIDGKFPDYERVMPKNNTKKTKLSADELKGAINRVSAVCDDRTSGVKMSVSSNKIEITSKDGGGSSATESMDLVNDYGIEVGFNYKFMADALSHVNDDECFIGFDEAATPITITDDSDSFTFIVMPMRLNF